MKRKQARLSYRNRITQESGTREVYPNAIDGVLIIRVMVQ